MEKLVKHFGVTVYLYDPSQDKFLFVNHKKLGRWVAPGGHLEENEDPCETATREVLEETGLQFDFVNPKLKVPDIDNIIKMPYAIQLNKIKENHEHLDCVYLGIIKDGKATLNERESNGLSFFSLNEIMSEDFLSFEQTKKWCKFFYNELHQR